MKNSTNKYFDCLFNEKKYIANDVEACDLHAVTQSRNYKIMVFPFEAENFKIYNVGSHVKLL